jgi:hypothetical protein
MKLSTPLCIHVQALLLLLLLLLLLKCVHG